MFLSYHFSFYCLCFYRDYQTSSCPFVDLVDSFNSRDTYLRVGQENTIRGVVAEPALSVDSAFAGGEQPKP